MSDLTFRETLALETYAEYHGKNWKSDLRIAWERGFSEGVLQELRNSSRFGPRGLKAYKRITRLEALRLADIEKHGVEPRD